MLRFFRHSNLRNTNIQFTVQMPTTTIGKNSILVAFLDTSNTVNEDGKIKVGVYHKALPKSKYLDFHSHSPAQSKRAVVLKDLNATS